MNLLDKLKKNPAESGLGASLFRSVPFLAQLRLSTVEALALLAALVFIGIVGLFYVTKVQPLTAQVDAIRAREAELRSRLEKRNTEEKKRQDQITNAELILGSLDDFENGLKENEAGIAQIINEIDTLGKSSKIVVGDASYRVEVAQPLVDEKGEPLTEAALKEKKETIYPGMAIDTTVIGDYPNLRRFIAALEQSRQFLIINSLAFQGEGDKVRRETAKLGNAAPVELSSPDSVPVSLKIELDTYFRRPRATP
ncbi:MAG: hypothetical protein ACK5RR_01375 [Acidobacteriota bacterium]